MTAAVEFPHESVRKGMRGNPRFAIESAISGWARGFMRGMHMRHDGWAELVNDEGHGGCLIPMMMLCHEHDKDPEMRPEPKGKMIASGVRVHRRKWNYVKMEFPDEACDTKRTTRERMGLPIVYSR